MGPPILRKAGAWFALMLMLAPRNARAQACCAGASAITPGRLGLHEDALVGTQARFAAGYGSYDSAATFHEAPSGTTQRDFEQDWFAAVRVLPRGQLSLLVPFVMSWRRAPTTGAEFGAGLGDVNLSARYDFTWAREVSYLPGIAALAGVTVPTGRPPESAHEPLGSDATGVGAVQLHLGLALERSFDAWLVSVTGLAAKRLPRHVEGVESDLGTQFTVLGAVAYVFPLEASLALVASFTAEGNADVDGATVPGTSRRQLQVAFAGSLPLDDRWRLQGATFLNPPVSGLGKNQPATAGVALTVVWAFL